MCPSERSEEPEGLRLARYIMERECPLLGTPAQIDFLAYCYAKFIQGLLTKAFRISKVYG